MVDLVDRCCPMKTLKISKNRPPYINDRIIEMGHVRDKLFKLARKTGSREDWVLAKRHRLLVNYAVRKAKGTYYRKKLEECKGDTRKFWLQIKNIMPGRNVKEITETINKKDGSLLKGVEAYEYINQYFCDIGTELVAKLDTRSKHNIQYKSEKIKNFHSWDQEFQTKEVVEEINALDVNKSSGFEDLNTYVVKVSLLLLKEEFTFVLNSCHKSCIFPDAWKNVLTVPIPKTESTKDVNNLRPISLLPVTGKIFERFSNRHLNFHMEGNGLYFERQGGFRAGRSTIRTAFELIEQFCCNYIY